jgi:molecular chaperone DnaJ
MNLEEAHSILELSKDATKADATKKFRELSKKFHPDNKATGDEAKFKKLNEAHQTIQNPPQPQFHQGGMPGGFPINFNFGNMRQQKIRHVEQIQVGTDLTFKESILGCTKKIKYNRNVKCAKCEGEGTLSDNGCVTCKGTGQTAFQRGQAIFVKTCDVCRGKRSTENCKECEGEGTLESEIELSVNIPGGVTSDIVMRLSGKGNFVAAMGPFDQYADAFLHLEVETDSELSFSNGLVIYKLSISLLDALRGCKKSVKTIMGDKEIEIKPLSKNKEELIIPHVGVNGVGSQKVIFDVEYPSDTKYLINALLESK